MVKACAGPSELHLKKELTALQRARFLRDPETCSSWRSPLSSNSLLAPSKINNVSGINGTVTRKISGASLDVSSRCESKGNKIYLCNWRHNSSNEEEKQGPTKQSPENLRSSQGIHPKSESYLEVSYIPYIAGTNLSTSGRSSRKARRSLNSRVRIIRHSAATKCLDSASSPLEFLNSGEQSDDTDIYNSEDLRQLTHGLTLKTGYLSKSASPLLSRSRCGSWSNSSKILKIRRDVSSQSCTPLSTSSYYKYGGRNPSTIGSWDGTAASYDDDELDQADLPQGQGCGIPCYWSKRSKDRTLGAFNSPSLSDTLKRKGSSILCGSQTFYSNKRRSSGNYKQKYFLKSSQGLPLLTNSCDGGDSSLDTASDELSTNLGELDLEALSRLDGKRWSSCQSQEGLELTRPGGGNSEIAEQRSLCQKYLPRSFDEIIGQNIVVQSLCNAILRGRIAPAYLFLGPRGTGKSSVARIFAAALNCQSAEANKPCWFCKECTNSVSRNDAKFKEVDATNKKGIDEVKYMLKNLAPTKQAFRYKVIVVDECHMLSSKVWSLLIKFLEESLPPVVFIFLTIEPDNLPRAIISRCQKYIFSKIKDVDITSRLRKISTQENFDVELEALDLIALNSDGSLRDAETMLEQLSLLGRKITTSLVNDVVGVVSDEKLLDLLEIAMSSDTAETIKRSRELIDSGVDPMALMSQLAGLIMDIIAGTYRLADSQSSASTLAGRSLTEAELERLQQALKILSDAEKQLRLSSERSTWFTAALLQLGSGHNSEHNNASTRSSSSKNSSRNINYGESNVINGSTICENRNSHSNKLLESSQANDSLSKASTCLSPDRLEEIWKLCIERCHSNTLRQLLSSHGRLVSVTEKEGILVASIAFDHGNMKSRAERFASSITNSIEIVLRQNVEVKFCLFSKNGLKSHSESTTNNQRNSLSSYSNKDRLTGALNLPRTSLDSSQIIQQKVPERSDRSAAAVVSHLTAIVPLPNHKGRDEVQELPVQMPRQTANTEQRLESAWLQAAEKYIPGSASQPKPDKNQVLPQNGINSHSHDQLSAALSVSSKQWEDELNKELEGLKINASQGQRDEKIGGLINYTVSPSLLHGNSYTAKSDKEMGYESGPGCNGLLCWKTPKDHSKKATKGNRARSPSTSRLSLFGQCGKLK